MSADSSALQAGTEKRGGMSKKAWIAMSGGVDSAVAAALTLQMGYEAEGVTLKLHDENRPYVCGSGGDSDVAKSVAAKLGISHRLLDRREDFSREVIDRFVSTYEEGDTPNPCLFCNRYLKFGNLASEAKKNGFDTLVTGHYARILALPDGRHLLFRAKAKEKDQSYVLYFLDSESLSHILFPLGEFESKNEVRALAASLGFENAEKPDSQDICFIPDGDYAAYIERRTGKTYEDGDYIDVFGNVLGRHRGMMRYTVGQRKGLGIALGEPMYVKEKSAANNTVTLAKDIDLYTDTCTVKDVFFVLGDKQDLPKTVYAKCRYRAKPERAAVEVCGEDVILHFEKKVRAVTSGQAAVFYADPENLPASLCEHFKDGGVLSSADPSDLVLGGGVIRSEERK